MYFNMLLFNKKLSEILQILMSYISTFHSYLLWGSGNLKMIENAHNVHRNVYMWLNIDFMNES